MIDAGLDAINISKVDAAGKEVFGRTRLNLEDRPPSINNIPHPRPPQGTWTDVSEADPVVRAAGQTPPSEQAFIDEWSKIADKVHITDLHNWAGTLNAKSDVRYPCYRLWLTFTVLWDGRVSLCCADFDGRNVLGDLRTSTIPRSAIRPRPGGPPAAPRTGGPGDLPVLRFARKTRRCG